MMHAHASIRIAAGHRPVPRGERGAVLIVSLVLLLVMTVLGVAAMNSSIMQGLMSASYQQQTVTLADAENRLLAGELDVEQLVATGVDGRAYFYNLDQDPDNSFPASVVDASWPNDFVVEYLGEFAVPGESVAEGGGFEDSIVHVFRVSARAERDDERGGLRILQSLYVTLTGPDE